MKHLQKCFRAVDFQWLYVGAEEARASQIHLLPPDSDVSWPFSRDFWGPKMLQNPSFLGLRPGPRWQRFPRTPSWCEGSLLPPSQEPHPRCRPCGPCFYGSQTLAHYRVGNPANEIDFKCRPIWNSYFFSFGEQRKWTRWWRDGGNANRNFGLEPPLILLLFSAHWASEGNLISINILRGYETMTFVCLLFKVSSAIYVHCRAL